MASSATTHTMPHDFAPRLIAWQRQHGRHHLPWQTHAPYAVWLSEIMLQQTQVTTVVPYYARFIERFPNVASLAAAEESEVFALWAGLGYYARARNLHATARLIMQDWNGNFPNNSKDLATLPGIGRSTAAAIAAFAFGERAAILDGNVKRVLCRHFGVDGWPGERLIEQHLWTLAEHLLPSADLIAPYTQGLMDLGSLVCTRSAPKCPQCPVQHDCRAAQEHRTADWPTPRPRKIRPIRHSHWLLVSTNNAILLEQRPQNGIWGGLYSLPEADTNAALQKFATTHQLIFTAEPVKIANIRHSFTHFHLEASVWHSTLATSPPPLPPTLRWTPVQYLADVGVPAPIRRILTRYIAAHTPLHDLFTSS